MKDYEFTGFTTDEVMNILLTMERDICDALRNCIDIKEGLFKAGTCLGRARSDIYHLLKTEEDKSNEAKEARKVKVNMAEREG